MKSREDLKNEMQYYSAKRGGVGDVDVDTESIMQNQNVLAEILLDIRELLDDVVANTGRV